MKKLLVVTSYPEKGTTHSDKTVGVASYTKILLEGLRLNQPDWEIKVLAEKLGTKKSYKENGIEIERVWKRNNLSSLVHLLGKIIRSDSRKVLLSFEFHLFGGLLNGLFGILEILLARILGKETYILLHQVATDFGDLEKNKLKANVLSGFSKIFYGVIKLSADQIFVFEKVLKDKLGKEDKIRVLPHLVLDGQKIEKSVARKKLGLKQNKVYGLYFGYIAPYKGVDSLIENWPKDKNLDLIVAGGINPNHDNDSKTVEFVKKVEANAVKKDIKMTGFVKERDIKYYYSAADFVILPYKMFFSSSGPLALAFAYKTPVLISKILKDYVKTEDFSRALKVSGLSPKDIVFDSNSKTFSKSIRSVLRNKAKFEKFALEIGRRRSIENTSELLTNFLNRPVKNLQSVDSLDRAEAL